MPYIVGKYKKNSKLKVTFALLPLGSSNVNYLHEKLKNFNQLVFFSVKIEKKILVRIEVFTVYKNQLQVHEKKVMIE